MKKQLIALQSFSGPDGDHTQGDTFSAADSRVEFLVSGGYAELAEPAKAEPKEQSKEKL